MFISIFDLFSIGIGPSSSHTVGPMRAAKMFVQHLDKKNLLDKTESIKIHLYGSLAYTGKGHGTDKALLLGLEGETPEGVDADSIDQRVEKITNSSKVNLLAKKNLEFIVKGQIIFNKKDMLPLHSNAMKFEATISSRKKSKDKKIEKIYYSVGGGFILGEKGVVGSKKEAPFDFNNAEELLKFCEKENKSISEIVLLNEVEHMAKTEVKNKVLEIWQAMSDCIDKGIKTTGHLPGGLKVKRRAPGLYEKTLDLKTKENVDPLVALDFVSLWAIAVNEENAAGKRVVTAPTNGAAGIIPAVIKYYLEFCNGDKEGVCKFLLTAAAICSLYKQNASISGAESGCQGEVGVACSMAAAALTEVNGGTVLQVENAAEIAMEHHLGLTCDPVGGRVQIPCIERNALGAVKAVTASRLALKGEGENKVSLDKVIKTMYETGKDMKDKYKETSRGGLAVNVIEC